MKQITVQDVYMEIVKLNKFTLKPASQADFISIYKTKIKPFLNINMNINDINMSHILDWYIKLNSLNIKKATKEKDFIMLKKIFKHAEKYHNIPCIIKENLKFKDDDIKKEMAIYTPFEFNKFISFLEPTNIYRVFFELLFYSGLRLGEALALTPTDLLNNNTININKSKSHKTNIISSPKSRSSYRKIEINKQLFEKLKIIAFFKNDNDCLFDLKETNIRRLKNKLAKKAELHQIRLHDFRHSHASCLISSGVSVTAVAKRLGHSDITMTLNIYSHCLPEDNKKISEIINLSFE